MTTEIRLNAFALAAPSHLSAGLWRHPRDRSAQYHQLSYWTDLAQLIERGKFDGLFLADGISLYDVYQGSSEVALRLGLQFPRLDPLLLVSAMAHVTQHIGFGITSSVTYEPPYMFARRMATMDHITNGRAGWNIVTSYGDSGTKAFNGRGARQHDDRYAVADDYLELVYKYWEGSWEDGAALRDRESGAFTDPSKIHVVRHDSEHFQSEGVFISEPSPQRTPVLYQAGASTRGREFAARHAECVFINAPSRKVARELVADTRRRAEQQGRDPQDIRFFQSLTAIPGRTRDEAQAKHAEYLRYASVEGTAALFSRWSGVDLSQYGLDDPITYVKTNAQQSAIEAYTTADPGRVWTVREVLDRVAIGGGGELLVGSPADIADGMQAWVEETGISGFNLGYAVAHESFADFVELVVPELQRRGAFKRDYQEGTLREKLFGAGQARLNARHPGAQARTTVRQRAAA